MSTTRIVHAFALLLTAAFAPAWAEATEAEGDHRNHVALMGGAVFVPHTPSAATVGADYAYRLPLLGDRLSVTALVELAFAEELATILGLGLGVHPVGGLRIVLAPGVELAHGEVVFLFRFGAGYDFHLGSFSLGPVIYADYVHGHLATVAGLQVGVGF